ncbi:MAG: pyridoxine 5'-phosphate synthase [Planctomycetota bacterium]
MPAKLSVNVNKIALLRNARPGEVPSVVELSRIALDAGAHGITVHPRPDARHVRPSDVDALAELLASPEYADREFNIEGNPLDLSHGDHLMPMLRRVRPDQATLVPDTPDQATSDHGFALDRPEVVAELRPIVEKLVGLGCRVSVFVDPEPGVAARAVDVGAQRVELYTESYARAYATAQRDAVTRGFADTARAADAAGLGVNAGHDLNLENLAHFVRRVPAVAEVSIGHALVADALRLGIADAVRAYLTAAS